MSAKKPKEVKKVGERPWPASSTETWTLDKLKLNDKNARTHTLEQIEQISASMKRFGWTIPVLVDETGMILAGHGRVRAARLMGYSEAPVVIARDWSEDEKRAYLIADNQLAANSEWDSKKLRSELRSLVASDFDVSLVGFGDEELSRLVIDAKAPPLGQAEEVTMLKCPACGRMSRKQNDETPGS